MESAIDFFSRDSSSSENKIETVSFLSHYKEQLTLDKPKVREYLVENINEIIKYELNKPNATFQGLYNILESFSENNDNEFCKAFLINFANQVQNTSIPKPIPDIKFDLPNEVNIANPLKMKLKFENLKKLFSAPTTNNHIIELYEIIDLYKHICQLDEPVDRYITDLMNRTIEPTPKLCIMANTPIIKHLAPFLDDESTIHLFLTRDHRKITQNMAEKTDEATYTLNELTNSTDQITNLNSLVELVGDMLSGGFEECKE